MARTYTTSSTTDAFAGYNHNIRIGDGEMYDERNMTSDFYPVLATRRPRSIVADGEDVGGMVSKDGLCYVDSGDFVIGGERIPMGLSAGEKTMISMGAYVIIMPDKMYINTADHADRGAIEATVVTDSKVTFELCRLDGSAYEDVLVQSNAPAAPENLDLWIDTSSEPHSLKQYSTTTGLWSTIATTYVKISASGIGVPFAVYDGVTISGVEDDALSDLNSTSLVWERGDDFIVITGIIDKVTTQNATMTVTRRMPNMDFIIESENRLWGCRYGTDVTGNTVNEIYASKLGDFKNWNSFAGVSTDSYAATVGSDGAFTGAITHLGYPLFFKENHLHKVYGNFPSNYQVQTTACRGVQKGCHKSLAIVGETLYYKSRGGVCAYDGSLPVEMSSALGDLMYTDAVGGVLGRKYYCTMREVDGDLATFVYDSARGMWHKEVGADPLSYCNANGELYYIDRRDGKIWRTRGVEPYGEQSIKWMVESGLKGIHAADRKYVSRMDVRLWLDMEAHAEFYIQYDSSGAWEYLFGLVGRSLGTVSVPIRPRRCDHFRLKIEGEGAAKVFSVTETLEQGSVIG
jgi:hypothetical protein